MSGFALLLRTDGAPLPPGALEPVLAELRPRAPDGESRFVSGPLGVAATWLRTGGPAQGAGHHAAHGLVVTGQLRLDARDRLAAELRAAGRRADPRDDDLALFAEAWAAWGAEAPTRLLGDYAVAVHDPARRTLSLVRDPFGVRLLFYHASPTGVVASNTLRAVLAAPGVPSSPDDDALSAFIATGEQDDDEATAWRGIRRVPAGCTAVLTLGDSAGARTVRHWRLPPGDRGAARRRDDEVVHDFREALAAAVRDRAVPRTDDAGISALGIMLSGGVDSAALAALARRARPAARIGAVTAGSLPGLSARDTAGAVLVAQSCGMEHTIVEPARFGYLAGVDEGALDWPEPLDLPDGALWRAMLGALRVVGPVALYGEDPDTLLFPPGLPPLLRSLPLARFASDLWRTLVVHREPPRLGLLRAARRVVARTAEPDDTGLLAPALRTRRRELGAELARQRAERARHDERPDTARLLAQPAWRSLTDSLDAGVTGIPIDVRLPYLDQRVVEAAMAAPALPWTRRKRLLREAVRGLVPDAVRLAPKRGAVGLAEARAGAWLAAAPAPLAPGARLRALLDARAVERLGARARAGDVHAVEVELRLRQLDRWLRRAVPG